MKRLMLLLAFLAGAGTAPAADQRVAPLLDCVSYNPATNTLTINWGYTDTNSQPSIIPIGNFNFFDPPPPNQGEPITFNPGVHHNAFQNKLDLNEAPALFWHLNLIVATATNDPANYCATASPAQQAELIASDRAQSDHLGFSVALSADGNTALIGAYGKNSSQGAAYVFTRSGASWTPQAELAVPGTTWFAYSVALSGDGNTALIAANGQTQRGAYLFTRSGTAWTRAQLLAPSDSVGSDTSVWAVALSSDGNTALLGAPGNNNAQGKAYIFARSAGSWTQTSVTASDGAAGDNFGSAVALSADGNTAAMGAYGKNSSQGAAYVFARSGSTWTQAELSVSNGAANDKFGSSVALSGDGNTALVGDPNVTVTVHVLGNTNMTVVNPQQGEVYVFGRSGSTWSRSKGLTSSDGAANDHFGSSVALNGDGGTALIGATRENSQPGAAYIFAASYNWLQLAELTAGDGAAGDQFGAAMTLSGEGTALIGAPSEGGGSGAAYVFFPLGNTRLFSNPPGRTFSLSGIDCPSATVTTPYSGYWSAPCQVTWLSPDLNTSGARYTFQNWSDGDTENPRAITPQPLTDPVVNPVTANFLIEYQLTTVAQPGIGGNLLPQPGATNWYAAGTDAVVSASANPGFVFTGFSGALTGESSPQVLTMNGPQTVTGNFSATPAATESGTVSAKSGPANARQWTISITNSGPGTAYNAQLVGLVLTQTFGAACTPVRDAPLLPVSLGDLVVGASAQTAVTFDFSSCPANARFTVAVGYVANGGSSMTVTQLVNQFQ
jgi:hypothetical protein